MKREGVTRDGADARMFDATSDAVDERAFAERCEDDRHHFRFIISPEDAAELGDLRTFTRELMAMSRGISEPNSTGSRSITGTPTTRIFMS